MNQSSSNTSRLLVFVFSIFAFLYFTGGSILDFSYIEWLSPGDSQYHWINWQFFRESPFFQIPIFKNYNYGMDLSSSIALNDSLPIMALIFKPFSNLLPFDFQYFGFWIFICFVLQGQLSFFMLERITKNQWICLFASAFFILSPPFLWRLWGHYSLMGHWLIILAIIVYYRPHFSLRIWIFTIILTALVNAYILAIVLTLFFMDIAFRFSSKEISQKLALSSLLKGFTSLLLSLYIFGYFVNGLRLGSGGYSLYRANLNTFFNDNGTWSSLIPNIGSIPNDYEGFAFLGFGMIVLLVLILIEIIIDKRLLFKSMNKKNLFFLAASLILFAFAVTNKITFGTTILFEFELPSFFSIFTKPLRSSGRMAWLLFYCIYFFIFLIISRSRKLKLYLFLLPILLAIQVLDMGNAASIFRSKISDTKKYYASTVGPETLETLNTFWHSPLTSPEWETIKIKYNKIIYVYPVNRPENAYPLLYFAAKNKISTNFGYFSRYNSSKKKEIFNKINKIIETNNYDKNSVYIFRDQIAWQKVLKNCKSTDLCNEIDGYKIFAMGFY